MVVAGRCQDSAGRADAVQDRHPNVHQHHIRPFAGGQGDRLLAVGRLCDDLYAGGGAEQRDQPAPDQRLIVGDEDPYRHGDSCNGRRRMTPKPPAGFGPAVSTPP